MISILLSARLAVLFHLAPIDGRLKFTVGISGKNAIYIRQDLGARLRI